MYLYISKNSIYIRLSIDKKVYVADMVRNCRGDEIEGETCFHWDKESVYV
jgi:hypothetical protein